MKASPSILIVDDSPDVKELLSEALSSLNPCFYHAANGIEALEILKNNKIDCIISDKNMPEMDGLALLEKVKEKYSFIPFIIITGFGDKESVLKAWSLGAFDFLEKPIRNTELQEKIQIALSFGQSYHLRKTNGQNRQSEVEISLKLPNPTYSKIHELAQKENLTENDFINTVIQKYLEKA